MSAIHVDARSWRDNWEEIGSLPSGGQGTSKIGRRRDGTVDRAFIKILNRQNVAERRARLYREAVSLETLVALGIPRLLETNARWYDDKDYHLYVVTEYVEGKNLHELERSDAGSQAINWAIQLCDILQACREAGIVHRDIKPDNCIVTLADLKLHLVDFGRAFRKDEEKSFETPIGQEVGNRFLRLPELQPDSANKDDPRTDLAGCVGLLFYLLTGSAPRVLLDESNRYPHQRAVAAKAIQESGVPRIDRLLRIFDQGFQLALDMRFQSAEALRTALSSCLVCDDAKSKSSEALIARILERTNSPTFAQGRAAMDILHAIEMQIYDLTASICGSLQNIFKICGAPHDVNASIATTVYRHGFLYALDNRVMLIPAYLIRHLGSEIVLTVHISGSEELALRVPANPGILDEGSLEKIRSLLLGKLQKIAAP